MMKLVNMSFYAGILLYLIYLMGTARPDDAMRKCTRIEYTPQTRYLKGDCVKGYLIPGVSFTGEITCTCNHCSGRWFNTTGSPCQDAAPRRPMIGCDFGAPMTGINCAVMVHDELQLWDYQENKIKQLLEAGVPSVYVHVSMDPTCYDVYNQRNCTTRIPRPPDVIPVE